MVTRWSNVCGGGTIMEYCDEWWKAGDPDEHDIHLEEWWGLFSVEIDSAGSPDIVIPREAYHDLREVWSQ